VSAYWLGVSVIHKHNDLTHTGHNEKVVFLNSKLKLITEGA